MEPDVSGVTEIYMCKEGQELREGELEISHSITTKEQAEPDAIARCRKNPGLRKVAYYAISESGSFKNFYTYANPNASQSLN